MIAGHWRLRTAAALLTGWSGDRDVLAQAADEFSVACCHSESWPAEITAWAESLKPRLFARATTRNTVAVLTGDEARRLADELLAFCEAALRYR